VSASHESHVTRNHLGARETSIKFQITRRHFTHAIRTTRATLTAFTFILVPNHHEMTVTMESNNHT
jgi:hypothetical protein